MKKLISPFIFLVLCASLAAQAPQMLNYQGVARQSNGSPLANQPIKLRLSIQDFNGSLFYAETQLVSTNQLGLYALQIGQGAVVSGNFSTIDWSQNAAYLKVEIDPSGGNNFVQVGSPTQLASVPYALEAAHASNVALGGDVSGDSDANTVSGLQNRPVSGAVPATGDVLKWNGSQWQPGADATSGGGSFSAGPGISISGNTISNTGDADNSPTNELQALALNGTNLSLSNGGGSVTLPTGTTYTAGNGININGNNQIVNTAPDQVISIVGSGATTVNGSYPNFTVQTPVPADNSPTNEIQSLSLSGNTLSLSNGGGSVTVDGSPTNEIQALSLSGSTLSLSNGGGSVTLNNGTNYSAGTGISIAGSTISNTGDLSNTNEIQALSLSGNTLSLSNGGGSVTLNNGTNYNAGSGISINGSTISATDNSATNEIQQLSVSGNQLSLSNGGNTVTLPTGTTYTAGSGISISGNTISNTGDTNAADDITNATAAGGDLNGTYPNPTVKALQGKAVSSTAPTNGQVLQWNGTTWTPTTPGGSSSGWSLTGNSGTNPSTNFIGTTDNQPLVFKINSTPAGSITATGNNSFFGLNAGQATTSGSKNTAMGSSALRSNTTGLSNTAFGDVALRNNTTGNENTAVGNYALFSNTTGTGSVAYGSYALESNTGGTNNTAIGNSALYSNTAGSDNTAIGGGALSSNSGGNANVAVGKSALFSNTTATHITAVGFEALKYNTTGGFNTALGGYALFSNTTGMQNTALGNATLVANTTGSQNTATGTGALNSNTTGVQNTANGFSAMFSNTTGTHNTAIGTNALYSNTTGSQNTAIGRDVLINNTSGSSNTANGISSLFSNITGDFNTANGTGALFSNTTGMQNTANGFSAMFSNTIGNNNTAQGAQALANNTIGNWNTCIGDRADVSANNLNGASSLGTQAITNANNKIVLGANISGMVIGGYAGWSNLSDGRFKENIQEDVPGLAFINQLRPVTYNIDIDKLQHHITAQMPDSLARRYYPDAAAIAAAKTQLQTGFIAQEVEAAAKQLGYQFDGVNAPKNPTDNYSIAYGQFVVPLVKAVQEQQEMIEQLKIQNQALLKRLELLEQKQ